MTDTVLLDIGPVLLGRIERVAAALGWSQQDAMIHLIEHGLFACEGDLAARFDATDARVLQAAIAALREIPDDPGFSLIGRADLLEGVAGSGDRRAQKSHADRGGLRPGRPRRAPAGRERR